MVITGIITSSTGYVLSLVRCYFSLKLLSVIVVIAYVLHAIYFIVVLAIHSQPLDNELIFVYGIYLCIEFNANLNLYCGGISYQTLNMSGQLIYMIYKEGNPRGASLSLPWFKGKHSCGFPTPVSHPCSWLGDVPTPAQVSNGDTTTLWDKI